LTQIDPLLTKVRAKNDLYIVIPSDLDLRPVDLQFALLVTLVQRCVSTKLEVSADFLFRENRTHTTDGRTDVLQHLMLPLKDGRIIISSKISCCLSSILAYTGENKKTQLSLTSHAMLAQVSHDFCGSSAASTPYPKKPKQNYYCHNFVKFSKTVIILATKWQTV